jgi:hypothetical protein
MIIEGYIEIFLAAYLGILSIANSEDSEDLGGWFNNYSDCICSLLTMAVFIYCLCLPLYIIWLIRNNRQNLEKPDF